MEATSSTIDWVAAPLSVSEQLFLVRHRADTLSTLASRGILHVNESGIFCARVDGAVSLPSDLLSGFTESLPAHLDDEWVLVG